MYGDFHCHTTMSDGALTPYELLEVAKKNKVSHLSITDHDTLAAYNDNLIFSYAKNLGITLLPGVEFSTMDTQNRRYHILGYSENFHQDPRIIAACERMKHARIDFATKTADLLREYGWVVNTDSILRHTVITKLIIAKTIIDDDRNTSMIAKHLTNTNKPLISQFIEDWIIPGKPCGNVNIDIPTPAEIIQTIHAGGGVAVLAHPSEYIAMNGDNLDELVKRMVGYGID
ncbi:MAG: PHP domain-containing protein [Candidatus Absconditabacterales bacterium]|nr:PHP domain-containing protein [Candidatus Absconditabacterales bacterium]